MAKKQACSCRSVVFLTAGAAMAQDAQARVQGTVTDPSQSVSVGTYVTLHNDNTDISAVKLTERFNLEFRVQAYNLTNSSVPKDAVVDANSFAFRSSTDQANRGREMRYTLRLHF